MKVSLAVIIGTLSTLGVSGYDNSRYDNVAVYWGQNSYGATHTDTANFQQRLSVYCQDNAVDVFPVAFVNTFFGPGGLPSMNLANTCNPTDNATFPGSNLPNCASLASDITTCQAKGKLVTISLGGAGGSVGFSSDSQAETFAQTIWDIFLGGSSSTRPFGSAVLDGVDLDIESGSSTGYAAFVNKVRSLSSGASKKYYITAAPQCVFPDASLGAVLNAASFDAVYVQFYNNPCGVVNFGQPNNWNFGIWDGWARTTSPNPNVKVFIGAPASSTAGGGYVDISTLTNLAIKTRKSFPSFGGVMLWDESQAYANNRYDLAVKNALVSAGGTGFTFPSCASAPQFVAGTAYTGGSQVAFNGYIWETKWWSQSTPSNTPNSDWSAISACSGSGSSGGSSTSTTTSAGSTTTGVSCAGVAAWSATTVYTAGNVVTYNSHHYTARWWTEGDTPGGSAGAWADDGACNAMVQAATNSKAAEAARKTMNSRFFRI